MVEFIHTSDWHLGNPFSSFTEDEKHHLSEARFRAVDRIFAYAHREGIRLILCAGDQIDSGELRDTSVLLRLFGIIARFPEIQVVMITGNHDPYTAGSIYTRVDVGSTPANLRLLSRPEILELPDFGVRLYAAPLVERYGRSNPIVELAGNGRGDAGPQGPPADDPAPAAAAPPVTIGLAHGSLAVNDTVGGESDAFPIPPAFAAEAGLDYLALGDWHSYLKSGDRTYYPGTHEPLAFGDDAGALHVRIASHGARPEVKRVDAAVMRWTEVSQPITDGSVESFLKGLSRSAQSPSDNPEDLGPLFEGGNAQEAAVTSPRTPIPDGPSAIGGTETILKLALHGYLSLERFKQLDEGLAMAEGGFFRVFREEMPSVRPSEEEMRGLEIEGYMERVMKKLISLGKEGNPTAEAAMVRVYEFFHAQQGRTKA